MAHVHIYHQGEALSLAAAAALQRSGEQWTPMRAAVFDVLAALGQPASAYDIADAVSQAEGRRVAPNSIYRILDLFVATNLARRVETSNAYVVNAHPECRHDCIFLVCDGCGDTTHIDDDHLTDKIRALALKSDFKPVRPVIEVRGVCATCSLAVEQ